MPDEKTEQEVKELLNADFKREQENKRHEEEMRKPEKRLEKLKNLSRMFSRMIPICILMFLTPDIFLTRFPIRFQAAVIIAVLWMAITEWRMISVERHLQELMEGKGIADHKIT